MLTVTLPFKRLDERAVIPQYAHEGNSGMYMYAMERRVINAYKPAKKLKDIT